MNKNYIITHLSFNPTFLIQPDDLIDLETAELLRTWMLDNEDKIDTLFLNNPDSKYYLQVRCGHCKHVDILYVSLTDLKQVITPYLCTSCRSRLEKDAENAKREKMLEFMQPIITNYLKAEPQRSFQYLVDDANKFLTLYFENPNFDKDYFANECRKLEYKDYLNTIYWKCFRYLAYSKSMKRCEMCGVSISKLSQAQYHHADYAARGYELLKIKDLRLLCKKCHEKHHEINS